jgi:tetratricopeptide (TPR) repeat protein
MRRQGPSPLLRVIPGGDAAGESEGEVLVMDLERAERLNRQGMELLADRRYKKARAKFEAAIRAAPMLRASHNNLALAAYAGGDVGEAILLQEEALREISPSQFGQASLAHYYLVDGRIDDAEALVDRLLQARPENDSALDKICEVLARLGRHEDIVATFRRGGRTSPAAAYFAGTAAANLGDAALAEDWLKAVDPGDPCGARAKAHLKRLQAGEGPGTLDDAWPYFSPQEVLPENVMKHLSENPGMDAAGNPLHSSMLVDAVLAMLNADGCRNPMFVETLASLQHPRVDGLLLKIAEGTLGSDQARMAAIRSLIARGVWESDTPHRVWLDGGWQQTAFNQFEISPDVRAGAFPPALKPRYEEAVQAFAEGRWKTAETLWRQFIEKAPEYAPAYHNLATSLIQQEQTDEAEQLLRKAMEVKPDYLFAYASLAILYCTLGRSTEAREVLDAVKMPARIHPDAMAHYCAARVEVCAMLGDLVSARRWLSTGLHAAPDHEGLRDLENALR